MVIISNMEKLPDCCQNCRFHFWHYCKALGGVDMGLQKEPTVYDPHKKLDNCPLISFEDLYKAVRCFEVDQSEKHIQEKMNTENNPLSLHELNRMAERGRAVWMTYGKGRKSPVRCLLFTDTEGGHTVSYAMLPYYVSTRDRQGNIDGEYIHHYYAESVEYLLSLNSRFYREKPSENGG